MPETIKDYQSDLKRILLQTYPSVKEEWPSSFGSNIYSPRVDLAVGPFAIEGGVQYMNQYDALMESSKGLVLRLIQQHLRNINNSEEGFSPQSVEQGSSFLFDRIWNLNRNARCFLAIEVENRVSRKHLMGGAINAAALGRIGIVVAWTPDKLKAFIRLRQYLSYLASVNKNTFDTTNLLILDKEQFRQVIASQV